MHALERHWRAATRARPPTLAHRALSLALVPLSWLYALLSLLKRTWFWRVPGTATEVDALVVAIGNPTVGGTGKTPLALRVARSLSEERGVPTVILCRGYGARPRRPVLLAGEGGAALAPLEETGDEARLLIEGAPAARVVVARRRALGARYAVEDLGAEAVVLDDALQYWRLRRDLDLVTLDGEDPFGNERLFPAGRLREPVERLARADALVIKSSRPVSPELTSRLREVAPGAALYRSWYRPTGWRHLADASREAPGARRGRLVAAACGLAAPEGFFRLAEELAGGPLVRRAFPDHHRFRAAELDALPRPVALTEKDARNLPEGYPGEGLHVLEASLEVEPLGGAPALEELVGAALDARASRS